MKGILIPLMLLSTSLFAKEVGNGGNTVVCFDDPKFVRDLTLEGSIVSKVIPDEYLKHITSIETLDLLEAKRPVGLSNPTSSRPVIELLPGEELTSYSLRVASGLDYVTFDDETISEQIKTGMMAAANNTHILNDASVFPQNDINPLVALSKSCLYATMAVQRSMGPGRVELFIDGRLYFHQKHSDLSKAVLLLHEYLLARSGYFGPNTESIREFVGLLIHKDTTVAHITDFFARRVERTREVRIPILQTPFSQLAAFEDWKGDVRSEYRISKDLVKTFPEFEEHISNYEKGLQKLAQRLPKWRRPDDATALASGVARCREGRADSGVLQVRRCIDLELFNEIEKFNQDFSSNVYLPLTKLYGAKLYSSFMEGIKTLRRSNNVDERLLARHEKEFKPIFLSAQYSHPEMAENDEFTIFWDQGHWHYSRYIIPRGDLIKLH